jgi:hypothetical protein
MSSKVVEADAGIHSLAMAVAVCSLSMFSVLSSLLTPLYVYVDMHFCSSP